MVCSLIQDTLNRITTNRNNAVGDLAFAACAYG